MTYQGSIFRKSPGALAREARRNARLRWAKVATLVAAGLLAGFVLQPAFGRDAYAAFYPVAPICAWALGPKPATVAALASAAVAYLFLGPATWPLDLGGLTALAGFLAVSAGSIALVAGLAAGVVRARQPAAVHSSAPAPRAQRPAAATVPEIAAPREALPAEPPRRRAIG